MQPAQWLTSKPSRKQPGVFYCEVVQFHLDVLHKVYHPVSTKIILKMQEKTFPGNVTIPCTVKLQHDRYKPSVSKSVPTAFNQFV